MRASSRIFPAVAAAILTATACSDGPTTPTQVATAPARLSAGPGTGPQLRSNSVKYREQSVPHQSNRSGLATLTTRALSGKDGNTVLEVTTGALDQASAPGSISKLQIKFLDPDGDLQGTTNYNGTTGGKQVRTFAGLARHSYIQTQANVRDIDPKRTDVVTVKERVNLRPDLAVISIDAPSQAKPSEEVIIVATVRELNGDVGARDDCVLYVDGSESRRINGQWVADGDQVNCVFRTSFADVGTHTIEVRAQNVIPGDWDTANNSASHAISIVSPEVTLHGNAQASEYRNEYRYVSSASWRSSDGLHFGSYDWRYAGEAEWRSLYFQGYGSGQTVGFPLTSINVRVTSGGEAHDILSQSNVAGGMCAYFQPDWYTWSQVCAYPGFTAVHGGFYGGVATYFDYYFYEHTAPGYYYTTGFNNSGSPVYGVQMPEFGADVRVDIRVESSNGVVVTGQALIPLNQTSTWTYYDQPRTCWTYSWPGWTEERCEERFDSYTSRWGSVSF